MIKMVFLAHKRADMSAEEFRRYWREDHGPLAAKIPGLKKYIQNHSIASPDEDPPPYDGLAEMWFESLESLETFEAQAVIADTENFTDVDRGTGFVVEEVRIL